MRITAVDVQVAEPGMQTIVAERLIANLSNCRFFEYPMPLNGYDQGMRDRIEVNAEGEVPVPQKPGLGLDVDWERMDAMTTARY